MAMAAPRWPWIVGGRWLCCLLLGAAARVDGCWAIAPVERADGRPRSRPAASSEAGAVLQATGYVTARRQATVSAQITGTLTEVLIEEGDHVSKGQVLARLEDSGYRGQPGRGAGPGAGRPGAGGAVPGATGAGARRRRRARMRWSARGLVSKQAAEQARTQVDSYARAARRATAPGRVGARRRRAWRRSISTTPWCARRSPAWSPTKAAQVGEIVSPLSAGGGFTRTGVGTIVDMDSLEIDVDVNEAYIGRVKPGMPAEAVLDAYPDWKIPAHVIAIVPAADRGKATIKVRVALEEKDARIVPDMGVRVSFLETPAQGRGPAAAGRAGAGRARSCSATAAAWCSWSRATGRTSAAVDAGGAGLRRPAPAACRGESRATAWWCRRRPNCTTVRPSRRRSPSPPCSQPAGRAAVRERDHISTSPSTSTERHHGYADRHPGSRQGLRARQAEGRSAAPRQPGDRRRATSSP